MRVLVTGANGFVGTRLCATLRDQGFHVIPAVRRADTGIENALIIDNIGPNTRWKEHLAGISVVIHLAARTHVVHETAADPLGEYRHINVSGTRRLALDAAASGVRRFVYLSSVKVHGETNTEPFRETDKPSPEDHYGLTKWEAEQQLHELAADTGLETTIIRSPLVYGPGVKANLHTLLRAVDRGLPLPFGSVRNKRSLVALDNLVAALMTAAEHPKAVNETYLVSDGTDLSTKELVLRLAKKMSRKARLLPIPLGVLRLGLRAVGKGDMYDKLFLSLMVDSAKIRDHLGWKPAVSVDAALAQMVSVYLSEAG